MTDDIDPRAVLDVLSDAYAREILETLDRSVLTAPEIADRCGFSRATVYRRLDTLEQVGLVTSRLELDQNGHHRYCYAVASAQITLSVCSDGLDGSLSIDQTPTSNTEEVRREKSARQPSHQQSSAD